MKDLETPDYFSWRNNRDMDNISVHRGLDDTDEIPNKFTRYEERPCIS